VRVADTLGLGILLRWKDKASGEMKKAQHNVDALSDSVDEASKRTAKLQHSFASLGKLGAGITAFGLVGAAALYGIVRAASTFQESLRDTMTMTGLTGEAFDEMEKQLAETSLQMSTRFGMAASEINKSFYQVLSAGATAGTKQFTALSESALMLAKVVGMEPAVAVESLSDALHSFEMDVADAEKMADVFFKTSMLGATTVPQMAEAMTEASKVAVEMKIPIEDLGAVLTGFAGKGIKGARAGTAFRMIMTRLAAPVDKTKEALDKLGIRIFDATTKEMRPILPVLSDLKKALSHVTHEEREAALKAIAGEEAFAKLGGLLATDLSILENWSKELKAGGVMQTAFEQKTRTLGFAWAFMRENFRNVAIVLGQHLLPILTPLVGWIGKGVSKVREFLQAHPILAKTAVIFGAVATAAALVVGPILTVVGIIGAIGGLPVILGSIAAGFASLGAVATAAGGAISVAFWPVTAIAAAVAGLYFAFKYNFLGIRTVVVSVGKVLWSFFGGIWEGVKSALTPLVATFEETWSVLKEAFAPLWDAIKVIFGFTDAADDGGMTLETFKEIAKDLGKVIGFAIAMPLRITATAIAYVVKGFAWLVQGAQKLGTWIGGKLAPYFGKFKGALLFLLGPIGLVIAQFKLIRSAVGAVIDWVSSNWSGIKDVLLAPVGFAVAAWTGFKDTFVSLFTSARDVVVNIFGAIRDSISGVLDWLWDKVTWVISKIPDIFLPESLEKIKYARKETAPVGGQLVVPATAPAFQRAVPRPTIPREVSMPAMALAGAGGGPTDQSVHIGAGAVVIYANKVDESFAMQLDRELAKILERRRERR